MAWLIGDLSWKTPRRLRGLASKAGARWLFSAAFATILLLLLFGYHYHDGLPSTAAAAAALPAWLTSGTGIGTGSASFTSPEQLSRRPAWIETPPAFDVRSDDGVAVTASLDAPVSLHPRLAERVEAFLARPVLHHEQARAQNEAACPVAQLDRQVNADQLNGDRSNWHEIDADRIVGMRQAAVAWLEEKSAAEGEDALIGPGFTWVGDEVTQVQQPVRKGSRGVVFAAGNHRTVEKAMICIREMQRLGWKKDDGALGLEVFHFEGEMEDATQRAELEALGATIRMVRFLFPFFPPLLGDNKTGGVGALIDYADAQVSLKKTPGQWKNFELKAESILRSSFDEVLYLDSDNFPLSDIGRLFEAALFQDPQGGNAVFWPDLNRDHPDNAIHRLLGIPCHDAWELDSGQVLIAKSGNGGLNLAALYLAQHMAEVEDGRYWFSGGDKDTL